MHTFQPHGSVSARLQSVGSVAVSQHCCTVSTPLQLCLHYVGPPAVCQLSCILSAQLQPICSSVFVMQFIRCDRPAARHQLSFELQAPLQSVIRLLSHDMSAWQQSVGSAATCQLSCTLLAEMKLVISATTCWLSCSLSAHLDAVHSAAVCQLDCVMSAWL